MIKWGRENCPTVSSQLWMVRACRATQWGPSCVRGTNWGNLTGSLDGGSQDLKSYNDPPVGFPSVGSRSAANWSSAPCPEVGSQGCHLFHSMRVFQAFHSHLRVGGGGLWGGGTCKGVVGTAHVHAQNSAGPLPCGVVKTKKKENVAVGSR